MSITMKLRIDNEYTPFKTMNTTLVECIQVIQWIFDFTF